MLYSAFDAEKGLYRVFRDDTNHAINGDLPVPRGGPKTQVGVAAIDSGRSLPAGAKPIGYSWHARGQVVEAGNGLGSLGQVLETSSAKMLMAALAGAALALVLWPRG